MAAIRALGARSVAVHVKDVDAAGGNTVVGEGTIDMPGVFAALRESRFDGLLVLEYKATSTTCRSAWQACARASRRCDG